MEQTHKDTDEQGSPFGYVMMSCAASDAKTCDEPLVTKPFLSGRTAAEVVRDLYGLETSSPPEELPSYCDQNFLVRDITGRKFVLKVINSEDSLYQAGCYEEIGTVLSYLQEGPDGAMYPAPVPNRHGDYLGSRRFTRESDGAYGVFLIALLSYVPGVTLSEVQLSNQLLASVGKAAAQLNKKLMEFKGPCGHLRERAVTNKWCLSSVAEVRQFLDGVPVDKHRQLAASVLDGFARDVKPIEKDMRRGVIHVDMNRGNILVTPISESANGKSDRPRDVTESCRQSATPVVTGIIDFCDMAYECLVYDTAGSLMDMMVGRKDDEPLVAAGYFLAGYTTVLPLWPAEWRCLRTATAARLAQVLVLSHEYYRLSGESDEYIMRIVRWGGWEVLKTLWETPQQTVQTLWKDLSTSHTSIQTID